MKTLLPSALHYASCYGWHVHPVNIKKEPTTDNGFYDATTDETTIREYFKNGAQLSIRTGADSGVFIFDVDVKPEKGIDGRAALADLEAKHGPLPLTPRQRTGSGGEQYLFNYVDGVRNSQSKIGHGIDIRGEGGYAVVAPSRNMNGAYKWIVSPDEAPIADAPQWLLDLLLAKPERPAPRPTPAARNLDPYIDRAFRDEVAAVATAPDGTKHDTLRNAAVKLGSLVAHGLDERTVEDGLYNAISGRADDPRNALRTIQDGIEYGKAHPREIPDRPRPEAKIPGNPVSNDAGEPQAALCSDLANARRLVERHGADLRYVAEWGWLAWDGRRWALDTTGEHERRAKATAVSIYQEAADAPEHLRAPLAKHAIASQSSGKLAAMISLSESELETRAQPDDFDNQPMLLTCSNGTLDLTTGDLLPHDRTDLLTKATDIIYDKDARAPQWLAFLGRIFNDNQDLIGYVQRAIGYTLTGSTGAQCMFICHGTGANGKSVLIDVVRALLGDYARNADASTFMAQQQDRIRSDVARLAGARFVATVEIDEGRRLSEALIKQVSSGDRMTARFLNKNEFEFTPRFKLWMASNHKPVIRGTDYAIWRRIRLIPFTVTIPEAERDPQLTDKLLGELPGVLAWAVQGCRAWLSNGLQEPTAVKAATNAYQSEMDVIGAFLDECTVTGKQMQTTCAALYAAYARWADESGEKAISQRQFAQRMTERGVDRVRTRNAWLYIGIGLLDTTQSPPSDEPPCDPCDPCDPKIGVFSREEFTKKIPEKLDHKDHKDHTPSTEEDIPGPPVHPTDGTCNHQSCHKSGYTRCRRRSEPERDDCENLPDDLPAVSDVAALIARLKTNRDENTV